MGRVIIEDDVNDFSGWNLGFAVGGWGGMFVGTIIITIMYLGLTYSIAEMSPALPHTGGAYSFARTAFGPWGGFITGVAENIEYVLTPAVIVYFIGTYLTAIFETPAAFQPVWWIFGYIIFVGVNTRGVELSFLVTAIVTLLAILILVVFFVSAIPFFDFGKYAMNIGADPTTGAAVELPDGHGPFLPFGVHGILASLPFAVWLFLAIEQLPLAAEESADPKRDMPKGIMLGMFTLIALGFLVLLFNPAIPIARDVTDAAGVTATVRTCSSGFRETSWIESTAPSELTHRRGSSRRRSAFRAYSIDEIGARSSSPASTRRLSSVGTPWISSTSASMPTACSSSTTPHTRPRSGPT
jgi:amino acid transporter